jgi:UDP-glucose 4-epimerase
MKVLVTGGAGYIGNALVSALQLEDDIDEVIIYDNLCHANNGALFGKDKLTKVTFVKADILDSYELEKALKGVDTVIHLAAHVAFPYNHLQNLQYDQINRWGTLNLVRAIQNNNSVKKVLYLSSVAVYGFSSDLNINDEPMPENGYGISKHEGEKYWQLLLKSHRTSIIRSANVYGFNSSMRLDGVINTFFMETLLFNKIKIFGDGTQFRAFTSLGYLVKKIKEWLFQESFPKVITAIQFNSSLNEIKDWIVERVPHLEYTYVNQNQVFPGQYFRNTPSIDEKPVVDELHRCWNEFKENIRIDISS